MGCIVLVILICVCRARNSSQPLFSALRLQEEEAFLCATEMPGARQRGNKGVRMNKPTGRGGGNIQAPAGSSRSWVGPAISAGLRFSHCTLCYLPRLGLPPTPSAQTCCLTSPSSSLLTPFCTKSASASLPISCLQPGAVMDKGAPKTDPTLHPRLPPSCHPGASCFEPRAGPCLGRSLQNRLPGQKSP